LPQYFQHFLGRHYWCPVAVRSDKNVIALSVPALNFTDSGTQARFNPRFQCLHSLSFPARDGQAQLRVVAALAKTSLAKELLAGRHCSPIRAREYSKILAAPRKDNASRFHQSTQACASAQIRILLSI
jgi:hypothetical protein